MKSVILSSLLAFLLFAFSRWFIFAVDLHESIIIKSFIIVGIALAFSWSVLLFILTNVRFGIGVNTAWLAIAILAFIHNVCINNPENLFLSLLFFVIFPIIFLLHYLVFNELRDGLRIRLTAITLLVALFVATYFVMKF